MRAALGLRLGFFFLLKLEDARVGLIGHFRKLGPHMVVIGALVPYLLLVGIPLLIRQFVQRLRSPPRPEQ